MNISSNGGGRRVGNLIRLELLEPGRPSARTCEAYVTVRSYGARTLIRIGARVTGAGTSAYSGYYVAVASTGAWTIIRIDNGGTPVTLATGPTQPLAAGDKIAIRIVGSIITALHFTASGGWAQVQSYDTAGDATRYTPRQGSRSSSRSSTLDDSAADLCRS